MRNKLGNLVVIIGIAIIAIGAFGAYQLDKEDAASAVSSLEIISEIEPVIGTKKVEPGDRSTGDMPEIQMNGLYYIGILEIPSQGLRLPIGDRWTEEAGAKSPCRYYGSIHDDNLVVCGHNNRAHFSKIKNLKPGDEVLFTDVTGEQYNYTVLSGEKIEASGITEMVTGDWDMTLFTCTFRGEARYAIRLTKI